MSEAAISFDRRQKAKASNEAPEGDAEEGGEDMFTRTGVVAE